MQRKNIIPWKNNEIVSNNNGKYHCKGVVEVVKLTSISVLLTSHKWWTSSVRKQTRTVQNINQLYNDYQKLFSCDYLQNGSVQPFMFINDVSKVKCIA